MPALLRGGNHPALPSVVEQPAGIDHRTHVAERFERIHFAGRFEGHSAFVQINRHHVAGFEDLTQTAGAFARIKLAGGDGVSEKDAGETLGQNDLAAGRTQGDGRMLPRAAAPEIFSADDNGIFRVQLVRLDEAGRIKGVGQPTERVAAEFLVFVRNRRDESQILRGNDLVGVDIVAHHINRAGKNRLHNVNLAGQGRVFNQNVCPTKRSDVRMICANPEPPSDLRGLEWEKVLHPKCLDWRIYCRRIKTILRVESAEDQTVRFTGNQEPGDSQEADVREDARLLAVIADGDQHALATLYRRRSGLLYSLLVRMLVNEMEAQEVLQDTFVRIWRRAREYDSDRASPSAWMIMIARGLAVDRLRARSRRNTGQTA